MTNPTPITTAIPQLNGNGRPRLAVMPDKPNCRHHNLKLLCRLHARMQRVLVAYTHVSEAIVRQIGAA